MLNFIKDYWTQILFIISLVSGFIQIRKANKEVLKARGIYRKRKQYQGNAKIMNRLKYYKKQKLRSKMVKEYEGKPDVYSGEATGIRRDYIRSRQIKS